MAEAGLICPPALSTSQKKLFFPRLQLPSPLHGCGSFSLFGRCRHALSQMPYMDFPLDAPYTASMLCRDAWNGRCTWSQCCRWGWFFYALFLARLTGRSPPLKLMGVLCRKLVLECSTSAALEVYHLFNKDKTRKHYHTVQQKKKTTSRRT